MSKPAAKPKPKPKKGEKPAPKPPVKTDLKPHTKVVNKNAPKYPAPGKKLGAGELSAIMKDVAGSAGSAYMHFAGEGNLSEVTTWISTGCPTLDLLLGGGFPVGRIVEVYGKKSSGKSTITQMALGEVQKMGGIGVLIDTEKSLHRKRAEFLGIDLDRLVMLEPQFLEDAFSSLFKTFEKIRESASLRDTPILVVWDTIVYTPSKIEVDDKTGEIKTDGMTRAQRAKILRAYMAHLIDRLARLQVGFVFVNHMTDAIGAFYPGAFNKPGGTAIEYSASLQVQVKRDNSLKMMVGDDQVGTGVKFKIDKTRLSIPGREVTARLNWFTGIDKALTSLDYLKDRKLVVRDGSKYLVPAPTHLFPDGVSITTGESGEKLFKEIYEGSPEYQQYLKDLMWADYTAVSPYYTNGLDSTGDETELTPVAPPVTDPSEPVHMVVPDMAVSAELAKIFKIGE